MITTYLSIYPDQTITNDISSFEIVDPMQVAISELSTDQYIFLIDNIDFKPTGIKAFHFTDEGECLKIDFLVGESVETFSFLPEDQFNFQQEADAAYKQAVSTF